MHCVLFLLLFLSFVKRKGCDLSDEDFAELLFREGTKISENQDLLLWNHNLDNKRTRSKRAYWGFDKLFSDALEATNDVKRLGQMVGGFIKENTQVIDNNKLV